MLQAPILPVAIIIAIAAVHRELHPGTVEAGWRGQRLFPFLAIVVVIV
jgi:two-component sensor histidine kinase